MQAFGLVDSLSLLIRSSLIGLFFLVVALTQIHPAFAQPTIKQFEIFQTTVLGGRTSAMALGAATQRLQLTAFGQTLRLRVEENSPSMGANLTPSANLRLLRGTLADKPTSWVRLGYRGSQAEGLIWDGRDLYAVEPVSTVAGMVASSSQLPSQGSIIFRLADTEIPPDADFCGTGVEAATNNGMTSYQSLTSELSRMQIAAATTGTVGIELSLLADAAFRNQYASATDAQDAILVRLNNLDGIFYSQIGVHMLTTSVAVYAGDSLTASTSASTLLDSLASLRSTSTDLQATGLTHLFTGRNLDGNTVGVAYVNSLCNSRYAVGLTESRNLGAWLESLIAAHEIGHNLGAIHDDEDICSGTPLTYLMAPQINGSSTFSQCSLAKFATTVPAAACVIPLVAANPQLPADLGTITEPPGTTFTWAIPIKNTGDLDTTSVQITLNVPGGITIVDGRIDGGTCVSGSTTLVCSFSRLRAGETKTLNLSLSADNIGTYSITATVEADNDSDPSDNAAAGSIAIRQVADISATFSTATSSELNANTTLGFSIANTGPWPADNVAVKLSYPADMVVTAVELNGLSCATGSLQANCTLPALAAGANATGLIHLRATAAGAKSLQVEAGSDNYDPVVGNNTAVLDMQVAAAAAATSNAGNDGAGGGGGEFDWLLLAGLLGLSVPQRGRQLSCRVRPQASA